MEARLGYEQWTRYVNEKIRDSASVWDTYKELMGIVKEAVARGTISGCAFMHWVQPISNAMLEQIDGVD